MNTFQQDIHRVSDAIARLEFLKNNNEEVSLSALRNVDTKSKEFKTLLRKLKKQITEHNTPMKTMSIEEVSKLHHINDVRERESA